MLQLEIGPTEGGGWRQGKDHQTRRNHSRDADRDVAKKSDPWGHIGGENSEQTRLKRQHIPRGKVRVLGFQREAVEHEGQEIRKGLQKVKKGGVGGPARRCSNTC